MTMVPPPGQFGQLGWNSQSFQSHSDAPTAQQQQTVNGYGEYDCFGAPENGLVLAPQRDPSQDEQAYQVRLMMMSGAPAQPLVAPDKRMSEKRLEAIQERFQQKIEELAKHDPPLTEDEAKAELEQLLHRMKGTPFIEQFTLDQLLSDLQAAAEKAQSDASAALLNW
jgi:hypothetical protein